jgi:hypothetical protein
VPHRDRGGVDGGKEGRAAGSDMTRAAAVSASARVAQATWSVQVPSAPFDRRRERKPASAARSVPVARVAARKSGSVVPGARRKVTISATGPSAPARAVSAGAKAASARGRARNSRVMSLVSDSVAMPYR